MCSPNNQNKLEIRKICTGVINLRKTKAAREKNHKQTEGTFQLMYNESDLMGFAALITETVVQSELQQICLLFYFRHCLCDSVHRGLVDSAYLYHASVLRVTVHHVIKGCEKVSQRLHEISLSVVLVETGRG